MRPVVCTHLEDSADSRALASLLDQEQHEVPCACQGWEGQRCLLPGAAPLSPTFYLPHRRLQSTQPTLAGAITFVAEKSSPRK